MGKKISAMNRIAASLFGDLRIPVVDMAEASASDRNKFASYAQIAAVAFAPGMLNGKLVASVGSNALTVALKTLAGNDPSADDPVYFVYRDATASNGGFTVLKVTAAASLVISSGSTMGFTSAVAGRLYILGFDDGGTFRLGAINCSTWSATSAAIHSLRDGGLRSSTAEGGAGGADSAGVVYTGTAVTSKPYRVLSVMTWDSGLATAGTWASGPTVIQPFGPGVGLPGDQIQRRKFSTTTVTTTASSTFQDTALTDSITLQSPANLVLVETEGRATGATAGNDALLQIHRSGTALGVIGDSGGGITTHLSQRVIDKPNSGSSVTYMLKLKNVNNTNNVSHGGGGNTTEMFLTEIVG